MRVRLFTLMILIVPVLFACSGVSSVTLVDQMAKTQKDGYALAYGSAKDAMASWRLISGILHGAAGADIGRLPAHVAAMIDTLDKKSEVRWEEYVVWKKGNPGIDFRAYLDVVEVDPYEAGLAWGTEGRLMVETVLLAVKAAGIMM